MSGKFLDDTGLSYLWSKIKAAFAPLSHTHDYLPLSGGYMTGQIYRKSSSLDLTAADNGLSSNWNPLVASARDKNDQTAGCVQWYATTAGDMSLMIDARNRGTGSNVSNQLQLRVKNDGTKDVFVSDKAEWRKALGLEYGTGTITKVYTNNGFTLESNAFYYAGNLVTIPIQFSSTTAFAGNGTTTAASIPSAYAPPQELRFPLFTADWSNKPCGYLSIRPTGNICFYSASCSAWFGVATYIRNI